MTTNVRYPVAIMATFLWIGFVCAISFMEAWLKFRAPGITLSLGLGIGKIVFAALNKVECFFAIVIVFNILLSGFKLLKWQGVLFFLILTMLVAQTFWLLPALDVRADLRIQGQVLPPSNVHLFYIILEVLKVVSLSVFGLTLFRVK